MPEAQPAGESYADIGDHVVHFSALSTDQIPPEVARAYNIVRSKNRAMLNVSVLREADDQSVPATVDVKTTNLTQQLKNVKMRRIEEQDAIDVLAGLKRLNISIVEGIEPEQLDRQQLYYFRRQHIYTYGRILNK